MGGPAIQHFHQSPVPSLTPKLDYALRLGHGGLESSQHLPLRLARDSDPLMSALDFPDLGLLAPTRSHRFHRCRHWPCTTTTSSCFQSGDG